MFNPYGYGYGQFGMNPYSPQQQNPQQTQSTNMDWIRVNGMPDVQNVTVQPGQKAWIMLANEPVFALKSADNMGITTTEFYRFEKYNPEKPQASEFVTRDELYRILEEYTAPVKKEDKE